MRVPHWASLTMWLLAIAPCACPQAMAPGSDPLKPLAGQMAHFLTGAALLVGGGCILGMTAGLLLALVLRPHLGRGCLAHALPRLLVAFGGLAGGAAGLLVWLRVLVPLALER